MKNKEKKLAGKIEITEATFKNPNSIKSIDIDSKKISKLLRSKKWRGVTLRKGRGKIGFYPEIDENTEKAKDWSLHVLTVPDLEKEDHEHFIMTHQEIRKIHQFLGKLLGHIEKLKNKNIK